MCVARIGFHTQEDGWCVGTKGVSFPTNAHAPERDASAVNTHVRDQETESGFAGESLSVGHFGKRMRALLVVASRWLKTMQSSKKRESSLRNGRDFERADHQGKLLLVPPPFSG